MSIRIALAGLAAAAFLAAGGCGGDDEESSGSAASGPALRTVSISETEFELDPATVTLDEAGTYTFKAVNDGGVDHALKLEGAGVEEETETIGPGESAELTVELKAGTYELYCPVGNHKDEGMKGSVSVAGGGGMETGEDDEQSSGYGY